MPLVDNAAGSRAVDLCSFSIPAGSYKLLVQAVGKPTMSSQITGAINYAPACATGSGGPGSGTPTLSFSAAPASMSISAGKSGSIQVTAKPQSGSFNDTIALSCGSLPGGLSCSFAPAKIVPGAGTAASTLTITAASVTGLNLHDRKGSVLYASAVLPFGIAGLALIGNVQRRRTMKGLVFICLLGGISLFSVSCGGNMLAPQSAALPGNRYAVTVNGNSSAGLVSAIVTVTVQ